MKCSFYVFAVTEYLRLVVCGHVMSCCVVCLKHAIDFHGYFFLIEWIILMSGHFSAVSIVLFF